jgi:hypothetical protein
VRASWSVVCASIYALWLPACHSRATTPSKEPNFHSLDVQLGRIVKNRTPKPSAWEKRKGAEMNELQRVVGGSFNEFGTFEFNTGPLPPEDELTSSRRPSKRASSTVPEGIQPFTQALGHTERVEMLLRRLARGQTANYDILSMPEDEIVMNGDEAVPIEHTEELEGGAADYGRSLAEQFLSRAEKGGGGPVCAGKSRHTLQGGPMMIAKERHGRMDLNLKHVVRLDVQIPEVLKQGNWPPSFSLHSSDWNGESERERQREKEERERGASGGGAQSPEESLPKKRLLFDDFAVQRVTAPTVTAT